MRTVRYSGWNHSSKGTVICPATSSTDRVVAETSQERIAVFEKSTGKVVAGVMAPTKKYLFAWLEEHPTYEVLKPGKQPADIKNSKNQDEVIRSNVRKSLRDILVTRCKETEMAINHDVVVKLARRIESELLTTFNETNQKYKTKYRSLIFNLKDRQNKILYKRVVSGEINPRKLVQMSPEQLATPELAQWRQQEHKHHLEMVKKREVEDAEIKKTPALKKTHKGEVERDDGTGTYDNLEIKAEPVVDRKPPIINVEVENVLKDTTDEHAHHLFDSNCKICTGKIAPRGETTLPGVSTTVIQAIPESSVPSPLLEDMEPYPNSPQSPDTSEITSPLISPLQPPPSSTRVASSARKQPLVWRGFVTMQKVARFVCSAYAVSGTCDSLMEILPDTIHVCGRIPPSQVWDYLGLLREGRTSTNKYLDVIRFEMSSDEEKTGYIKLYTYFYTRQRIGVIGNCYSGIKDIYILPLASHDPIPTELRPLPGLPKPRPHMLLGIIVRVKSRKMKVRDFAVDSSPEVVAKKKKKKKEKKKEKEMEKEAEKEKDRDLEREKAEIVLERERVELEAQKKLIDIIFKNRANDGFPPPPPPNDGYPLQSMIQAPPNDGFPPHTMMQAPPNEGYPPGYPPHCMMQGTSSNMPFNTLMVGNGQLTMPQGPLFQPMENITSTMVLPGGQSSTDMQMEGAESNTLEAMSEDHRKLEEEQLQQLKEQQREILQLQTEVGANLESEVVMIPDPESMAKSMRQITEGIHDDSELSDINDGGLSDGTPGIEMSPWESNAVVTTTNATEVKSSDEPGISSSDESPYPSQVQSIVSLININASLAHPLKPEEKNPIFQAWLESSTKVKPVAPPIVDQPQIEMNTQVPVHSSPSPTQPPPVNLSADLSSANSSIDTDHLKTILSSIACSVAQGESISVSYSTEQRQLSPEQRDQSGDINAHSINQSLSVPYLMLSPLMSHQPDIASPIMSNQPDTDRQPIQHFPDTSIDVPYSSPISSRLTSEFTAISPASLDGRDPESPIPYSSECNTPVGDVFKSEFQSGESSQASSAEEEQRQKSDDEFALDLLEDIPIPRRATLFSKDLINMRAGIKMPELPVITLPEQPETNIIVAAIPPPPIPSSIPQVPIPPDIKLPPGVPFPPLPPPPPTSTNTLTIRPEDIEDPVEDIRTQWNRASSPSPIDNSRFIRPISTPQTSTDSPRFNRPVSSGSSIFRPVSSGSSIFSKDSQTILPPQGVDIRPCLPPRDTSRDSARDIRMSFSAGSDNRKELLNKELIEDIEESLFGEDRDDRKSHTPRFQLKQLNPRIMPEPIFRGMRPPIQPIPPLPGQGPRISPPRQTLLPPRNRFEPPMLPQGPMQMNRFGPPPGPMLGNRFGPPMSGGPMSGGPMSGGPMSGGPMPGGPLPGGPLQRNPFPLQVPPGAMLGNRLGPPRPPEGNIRPPFGFMDGPLLRNDNPRNFDMRPVRPPFQEFRGMRGRGQRHPPPGEQLFDVPRPRMPLDPHLRPDRPDCMPPPFHSQRPPFRHEDGPLNDQPPPRDPDRFSRSPEYEEKFGSPEYDRRNRPRQRKYDRYDRDERDGFNRNNRGGRGGKGFQKNRQEFQNYDRRARYEGKRDSDRSSSGEFRYREKHNEERDRYDSKSYERRDWPRNNNNNSNNNNNRERSPEQEKYEPLAEPEELEEGEVL